MKRMRWRYFWVIIGIWACGSPSASDKVDRQHETPDIMGGLPSNGIAGADVQRDQAGDVQEQQAVARFPVDAGAGASVVEEGDMPLDLSDAVPYVGEEHKQISSSVFEPAVELEKALSDKRECDTDRDCVLIYSDCPLSCGTAVAAAYAQEGIDEADRVLEAYYAQGGSKCDANYADCAKVGLTCKQSQCMPCRLQNGECSFPPEARIYPEEGE